MLQQLRTHPATAEHEEDIIRLALANHMFEVGELDGMAEMLHGYLDGSLEDHHWVVAERRNADVVGAAYYAPEPFADRLWNLYFIAVDPDCHGVGAGTQLLGHVERALQDRGEDVARILIVETSSTDAYANARGFYRARGYDEEARIRDFYGPGDDKVVYWKALTNRTPEPAHDAGTAGVTETSAHGLVDDAPVGAGEVLRDDHQVNRFT